MDLLQFIRLHFGRLLFALCAALLRGQSRHTTVAWARREPSADPLFVLVGYESSSMEIDTDDADMQSHTVVDAAQNMNVYHEKLRVQHIH